MLASCDAGRCGGPLFHFGTIPAIVFVAALQGHNPEPIGGTATADENARETYHAGVYCLIGRWKEGAPFPPLFHSHPCALCTWTVAQCSARWIERLTASVCGLRIDDSFRFRSKRAAPVFSQCSSIGPAAKQPDEERGKEREPGIARIVQFRLAVIGSGHVDFTS